MYLLDKILLFLFAGILSVKYMLTDYTLVIFCIGATFTCLFYILEKERYHILLVVLFSLLSILVPEFSLFIPLLLYDIIFSRIQLAGLVFLPPVILGIGIHGSLTIFYLIFMVSAATCKYKTRLILELRKKYINYRDTAVEYNNLLQEKNRRLIESQDYEIKAAALNERNRISKELHDSIGHLLSRSMIQAGALGIISQEESVREGLKELKDSLSEGMDSVRSTIHNMRDDSFDLHTSIIKLIREFTAVSLHFEYNMQSEPPIEVKYCMVYTIKEGLANIIKHSSAAEASVAVLEHTGFYQLIIYDNGKVKNRSYILECMKEESGQDAMGLAGMAERVRKLKGIINVNMEDGFKIFISIPKNKEERGILC